MRVESLALGLVRELVHELSRGRQRVLPPGEFLDELRPTLEELGQIVAA